MNHRLLINHRKNLNKTQIICKMPSFLRFKCQRKIWQVSWKDKVQKTLNLILNLMRLNLIAWSHLMKNKFNYVVVSMKFHMTNQWNSFWKQNLNIWTLLPTNKNQMDKLLKTTQLEEKWQIYTWSSPRYISEMSISKK